MDFYRIVERSRKGEIEIYPDFRVAHVTDLLVRGGGFYAVWMEERGLWSTDILDVQHVVDNELWKRADEVKEERHYDGYVNVKTMESDSSGSWARFVQYLKRYPDSGVQLDDNLTFANTKVKKTDYISRRLPYALEAGDYSAWDKLIGRLYEPSEREKIEWSIGAIISGDSKKIQKFFVFYGEQGSGKSTIINVIQKLFDGYYTTFDAKALGSPSNQFATEAFRTNPLVAIEHDGDLSRIEDNTRINSIVSHEMMTIKEKFKPEYMSRANCFLYIGTNKPVKITDAKSGLIRRLIDIHPSGKKFPSKEYEAIMSQIDFELGAIAWHCLEVYRELGKNYYQNYTPRDMILKTDVFYNFVEAKVDRLETESVEGGISLSRAYEIYKEYCNEALVEFKLPRHKFREELKNYYISFEEIATVEGKRVRSWYKGFKSDKLEPPVLKKEEKALPLVLDEEKSLLDDILADCPAQYAKEDGAPEGVWDYVTTKLAELDTTRLHYVLVPKKLIVIDFDIRNADGEKDMLMNLEAASKFPPTYAEFSKGGAGIHLHYWYEGDLDALSPIFGDGIEVKVFRGKAALRRRLSKCNGVPIATLNGGLPLKEEKMVDISKIENAKHLENIVKKSLRKENVGFTKPEIDLIAKVLEEAYASGMSYDVSNLEHDVFTFAMSSTNNSDYCVRKVRQMKFMSKDHEEEETPKAREPTADFNASDGPLIFFDCEVFPNLFLANWKEAEDYGPSDFDSWSDYVKELQMHHKPIERMVNAKPESFEALFGMKLVGFNCRKYDNHMLYARYLGYNNGQIFDLSQRIIVESAREAFFREAYNLSYTDIYDFCSKKQSLKKWEIELGIHHQELGLPWDKDVPQSQWQLVAEYCDNDVIATEAVFNARHEDFVARQILAEIAGGSVNDTTNQLTTRIIFGNERHPKLVYTDLATGEQM